MPTLSDGRPSLHEVLPLLWLGSDGGALALSTVRLYESRLVQRLRVMFPQGEGGNVNEFTSGGTPIFTLADTVINSLMAIAIGYLAALAIHSRKWSDKKQRKPRWPDHG